MRLVDSSVWVEFLRRRGDPAVKQVIAHLLQADLAAYTCPVLFELRPSPIFSSNSHYGG